MADRAPVRHVFGWEVSLFQLWVRAHDRVRYLPAALSRVRRLCVGEHDHAEAARAAGAGSEAAASATRALEDAIRAEAKRSGEAIPRGLS